MINENIQHEMFLDRPLTNTISILPPQLTFNNEKISSITPYIKEIKYSPNTGLHYKGNNTIKFLMNSTGFIDPYGTYLALEIENNSDRPIQFDNSAHSLISSLVISSNGNVIEEINDYDIINSIIFDSTFNIDARKKNSDICFGTNEELGCEGTCETILYDKYTSQMYKNDQPIPGGNNVINNAWDVLCLSSSTGQLPRHIKNLTNNTIVNGKVKRWEPQTKLTILLPLMSNIFGFGLSLQNYKWIPLEIFPNLEFSITLNPYAFFTPLPYNIDQVSLDERDNITIDFNNSSNTVGVKTFDLAIEHHARKVAMFQELCGISDNMSSRNYQVSNPRLITTQLFFDSSVLNVIRDMALKNGFILETQLMQSFQQKYFKQSPENTYVLNVPRKSVRSVTSIFLNKIYEKASICRKLKRYSRGVKKFQIKIGEDYYPYNSIEGNASNNCGSINNTPFIKSWEKVFYKNNSNFGDSIINNFNFAIDHHYSDILYKYFSNSALQTDAKVRDTLLYMNPVLVKEDIVYHNYSNQHAGFLSEHVGRAIFSISLDQIPMSGNIYKSGVDTRFTKPILLEFYSADIDNNNPSVGDNYFVQYVILEYDYTIKIGYNGFIVKEF